MSRTRKIIAAVITAAALFAGIGGTVAAAGTAVTASAPAAHQDVYYRG